MILPIYIYGQNVLRKVAQDIPADFPDLPALISDMFETLTASEGIGLAAPQVGKDIRDNETDTQEEGCLRLPGVHEKVTRPTRIKVRYEDADRQVHEEWVGGYLARVMQHEFDHLEGKVFVDRISPFRKTMIKSKLKALLQGRYHCGYRTKAALKR